MLSFAEHSALTHLTTISSMAEDLRNLGSPIPEQQLLMKALLTLPPSYRGLQSNWLGVPLHEQTMANLTTRLLSEEVLVKTMNNGAMDPADEAFFARHSTASNPPAVASAAVSVANEDSAHFSKGGYRGRGGFGRGGYRGRGGFNRGGHRHDHAKHRNSEDGSSASVVTCYNCNGTGHKAFQCPSKRNEERKEHRSEQHSKNRKSFGCVSASLCLVAANPNLFYADSAATSHMTYRREFFSTFESIPPGSWKVSGIGGVELEATGKGTVDIISRVNGEEILGVLKNVLFVPGLNVNLFSVGTATKSGVEAHFQETKVFFKNNGSSIMVGERIGDSLYCLHATPIKATQQHVVAAAASSGVPLQLLHQRFAHANFNDIRRTIDLQAVEGISLDAKQLGSEPCDGCSYGKMHRLPFPSTGHEKATQVGDLVHGDVGIVNVNTHDGHRFYSLLKDDASEFTDVKLLKKKNEAAVHVIEFCEKIKTQTGRPVKIIRTDRGTEYGGERFTSWKQNTGIIHQTTCRYTPQQNGVSERANRTVMEGVRSSLYSGKYDGLPTTSTAVKELWGEFLCATVYIRNRIVTAKNKITPFEKFFNQKPSVSDLRILGCEAVALIPDTLRSKLDPTSVFGWLVGYPEDTKGWRIWLPAERKVVISRDVKFNESKFIGDANSSSPAGAKHNPCEPFRVLNEVLIDCCGQTFDQVEPVATIIEGTFFFFFDLFHLAFPNSLFHRM